MLQDENRPTGSTPAPGAPKGYEAFSMLQDLVYMLSIITILFVFFFRLVGVDGSSMYPTFVDRDYLVLESNVLYHDIESGDIVVMNVPYFADQGPIVKRVIATEGETVDIDFDTWTVTITDAAGNAQILDESYRKLATDARVTGDLEYPVKVGEGQLFVMGDNRNHSLDSRSSLIGLVDENEVLGKVLFRFFPFNKIGTVR